MTFEEELHEVIGERDADRPLTSLESVVVKSVLVRRGLPVPADGTVAPQTIREWLQWSRTAHPAH